MPRLMFTVEPVIESVGAFGAPPAVVLVDVKSMFTQGTSLSAPYSPDEDEAVPLKSITSSC